MAARRIARKADTTEVMKARLTKLVGLGLLKEQAAGNVEALVAAGDPLDDASGPHPEQNANSRKAPERNGIPMDRDGKFRNETERFATGSKSVSPCVSMPSSS